MWHLVLRCAGVIQVPPGTAGHASLCISPQEWGWDICTSVPCRNCLATGVKPLFPLACNYCHWRHALDQAMLPRGKMLVCCMLQRTCQEVLCALKLRSRAKYLARVLPSMLYHFDTGLLRQMGWALVLPKRIPVLQARQLDLKLSLVSL